MQYKAGTDSSIGANIVTIYHYKEALKDLPREMFFTQLADTTTMPMHMGKTIKLHHYLPLLDDRNVNDEGIDATGATISDGNLYGSSRDIGTILAKIPALTENGGKVNRVGYTRVNIEGTIQKLGFYSEFTDESRMFDDDDKLITHMTREALRGANEIVEDLLAIDLINGAGVIMYGGDATDIAEVTGADGSTASVLTYDMLVKLNTELNNNKCPRNTEIITGSRMIDTKTISSARYLYISPEVKHTVLKMKNYHDEKAFIPVHHYAEAGNIANGEEGSVDNFRIIVVNEMPIREGAGAAEGINGGYRATGGKYDVHPVLCVGNKSFTTIGFQTGGKSVKFKVKMSMPGSTESYAVDPYGETGFYSIKWYYGTMILRPEWLVVCNVVAEL
jgi:N4-gp56 family major capsid protein